MAPDMSYWLGRKYALLQQQANTGDKQADTQRIGTVAAAGLDNTRAALLPKESAASIAKSNAETGLIGQQTQWYAPEAKARIAGMDATTAFTGTQNKVLTRESLTPTSQLFGASLGSMPSMYKLSGDLTAPANSTSIASRLLAKPRDSWSADDLDEYQTLFPTRRF